jgi:hypothetical protein
MAKNVHTPKRMLKHLLKHEKDIKSLLIGIRWTGKPGRWAATWTRLGTRTMVMLDQTIHNETQGHLTSIFHPKRSSIRKKG